MDTVTYADRNVQELLTAHFVRMVLDVVKDKKSVALLNVDVVPVAIIALPDGTELARIKDFVPPKDYLAKLKNLVRRDEGKRENGE